MNDRGESGKWAEDRKGHEQVDAAGWAVLFIWIGIVPIANISGAISLFGIGCIILAAQVVRGFLGGKREWLPLTLGGLFAAGGIWKWFQIQLELLPVLCIAAGVACLAAIIARRPRGSEIQTHS